MTITNQYLTHNRPYTKRSCTDAIAMHWVANPGTSAMANRNYFQNTSTEVSANYIIGLVGEVICCIPDGEVSWCTNQANGYTVSIECCHPDWTGRFNGTTYKSMVELTASLCKKYGLHPLKGGVIRHFDVTGKNCPKWFVPKSKGGSDTENAQHWHKFLADVAAQMGQGAAAAKPSGSAATTKLRYDWKRGQRVQLYKEKTQLFANESATTPAGYLPKGTYYIYDGKCCRNGRYRVTTKAEYCGKTPAGKYVTGYVSVDNFREA